MPNEIIQEMLDDYKFLVEELREEISSLREILIQIKKIVGPGVELLIDRALNFKENK